MKYVHKVQKCENNPKQHETNLCNMSFIYQFTRASVQNINQNIHDRYIETDKVKILLSSGLYHLSTNSQKDFTYMVKIK